VVFTQFDHLLTIMQLSARIFGVLSALVVAVHADQYKLTWYNNYSCQGNPVSFCVGNSGCCSAPGGINSVYIEWDPAGEIIAELNWEINANAGCNSPVAYDTAWTAPGPGGTGCFNAHNAAVGSVLLGDPAS